MTFSNDVLVGRTAILTGGTTGIRRRILGHRHDDAGRRRVLCGA